MTTNPDWGLPGEHTSEGMRALWRAADALNGALTPDQLRRGERWIPWAAVEIRPEILPREQAAPDLDTVARYAAAFDALPAIKVQAGTLVLIDGLHRVAAAPVATRDHIRATFADVADADLEDEATRANVTHGRPLTASERKRAARRMYERHHPDTGGTSGVAWTPERIAEWAGVHRGTIYDWRGKEKQRADEAGTSSESDELKPAARLGADGKSYSTDRIVSGAAVARPTPGAGTIRPNVTYTAPKPKRGESADDETAALSQAFATLALVVRRHRADELAASVVPDRLSEQAELAGQQARWWKEYADTLRARMRGGDESA